MVNVAVNNQVRPNRRRFNCARRHRIAKAAVQQSKWMAAPLRCCARALTPDKMTINRALETDKRMVKIDTNLAAAFKYCTADAGRGHNGGLNSRRRDLMAAPLVRHSKVREVSGAFKAAKREAGAITKKPRIRT